jgi:hypothetical protein
MTRDPVNARVDRKTILCGGPVKEIRVMETAGRIAYVHRDTPGRKGDQKRARRSVVQTDAGLAF